MDMRMVRFCRSMKDVLTWSGSGLPSTRRLRVPMQLAGL